MNYEGSYKDGDYIIKVRKSRFSSYAYEYSYSNCYYGIPTDEIKELLYTGRWKRVAQFPKEADIID